MDNNNNDATTLMGGVQPCLTLVPPTKSDVDETEIIELSLKLRAGSGANAPTYKRKVARFNGGSPAEWIEVLEALDEIFAQNGLTAPQDRENVVRTILRGDSLTAFESSLQESRENPEDPTTPLPISVEMITKALMAVSNDVFPHRALCNQIRWMQRRMRKPATMGIRQFVAAVTQMNGKLIRFPGATTSDLFKAEQLVELMEFALPNTWRAKFDLAGYIPTDHDKYRLVAEGEQIERAAALAKAPGSKPKPKHSAKNAGKTGSAKNNSTRKGKNNGPHSANAGSVAAKHVSPAKAENANATKNFSGRKFRKDLYALSKGKDRVQVIDQFAAVLKKERAKAVKQVKPGKDKPKNAKAKAAELSEDSSDTDESIHVMDVKEANDARMRHVRNRLRARFAQVTKKRQVKLSTVGTDEAMKEAIDEPLEEEKAFHKQVNRTDEGQTTDDDQTTDDGQTLKEGEMMSVDGQTTDDGQTTKKSTRKN
ncbi:MAG: hypothetical protein ACRCT2_04705 [Plesiomonas shigelloides]